MLFVVQNASLECVVVVHRCVLCSVELLCMDVYTCAWTCTLVVNVCLCVRQVHTLCLCGV